MEVDIRAMCRLCARCDVQGLQDLFASHSGAHAQAQTSLIIETVYNCSSVKIIESDKLPTKVCGQCWKLVETIHNFKKQCLLSDAFFQRHLEHLRAPKQELCQSVILLEDDSVHDSRGKKDHKCDSSNLGSSEQTMSINEEPEYDFEIVKVEIEEEDDSIIESFRCTRSTSDNKVSSPLNFTESMRVSGIPPKQNRGLPKNQKFSCQLCLRSFASNSCLSRHKQSHIKKIMRCKYCNKEFKNQESWHRHERMHTKDNPYKCHMCGKSYTSCSSHAAHVRKHTGETPFSCNKCNETFYLISSYERHVAKHRGVKEFKCEICNSCFWVKDDLRAHVNRMH